MLKQTITFTDFNGQERTKDLYFNLTEFELIEIQVESEEGIQKEMEDAVAAKDLRRLLDFIKMLVHKAYGEKSADGLYFEKSPEILQKFVSSALYSDLLLHLFQEEGARAEKFITGLMPKELLERAIAKAKGQDPTAGFKPDARQIAEQRRQDARIPAPTVEGAFNEAPAIGGSLKPTFVAPEPAPVQEVPQTFPEPTPEPDRAPKASPSFTVKETPLDENAAADIRRREAIEREQYEEWKRQQRQQNQQ